MLSCCYGESFADFDFFFCQDILVHLRCNTNSTVKRTPDEWKGAPFLRNGAGFTALLCVVVGGACRSGFGYQLLQHVKALVILFCLADRIQRGSVNWCIQHSEF
jgi:hypothetical protein